jgi:hypothetical protein
MNKSFSELSLNITEKEYRDLSYLSYSAIAKYEKGGFQVIPHLYDKQESDALLFGSVVDSLITEGPEGFSKKFAVAEFTLPSDTMMQIADILGERSSAETFDGVEDSDILAVCAELDYQQRLKDETKVAKVREGATLYYNIMKLANGRTIVSPETYQEALAAVGALKQHPVISKYLGQTEGEIEILYQQKFTADLDGVTFKCMPDILVVLHERKVIIPVDLKTSSFPEYDFPKRYLENRYDIQARLYTRILSEVIKRDDYFKDFEIGVFRFIVVNKFSKTPLIFFDENAAAVGDIKLTFQSGRSFVLRDPVEIGKELSHYLTDGSIVPDGINVNGHNLIYERLKLL